MLQRLLQEKTKSNKNVISTKWQFNTTLFFWIIVAAHVSAIPNPCSVYQWLQIRKSKDRVYGKWKYLSKLNTYWTGENKNKTNWIKNYKVIYIIIWYEYMQHICKCRYMFKDTHTYIYVCIYIYIYEMHYNVNETNWDIWFTESL